MTNKNYEEFKRESVKLRKKLANKDNQTIILAVNDKEKKVFHDSAMSPENAVMAIATELHQITQGDAEFQLEMLMRITEYVDKLNSMNYQKGIMEFVKNQPRNIIIAMGTEPLKF